MKRIASIAAAVALGMLPVAIGSTGSANAAPAPEPKTEVSAQACGLNQLEQTYTNCRGHPHVASIVYMDSVEKATGIVQACVQPGTTAMINLIGPFRLAINSTEAGRSCDLLD